MKNLEIPFEEALKELTDIVQAMEQGQMSLDQMMAYYERGLLLKAACDHRLKSAEMKIETLQKSE